MVTERGTVDSPSMTMGELRTLMMMSAEVQEELRRQKEHSRDVERRVTEINERKRMNNTEWATW